MRREASIPKDRERCRISFEAANLIGSSQDDSKVKGPTFRCAKNGARGDQNRVNGVFANVASLTVMFEKMDFGTDVHEQARIKQNC
jgi:hypothetical protein